MAHLVFDSDPDTDEVPFTEFMRVNETQQRMHREELARIDRQCLYGIVVLILLLAAGVGMAIGGEEVTFNELENTSTVASTDRRDGW